MSPQEVDVSLFAIFQMSSTRKVSVRDPLSLTLNSLSTSPLGGPTDIPCVLRHGPQSFSVGGHVRSELRNQQAVRRISCTSRPCGRHVSRRKRTHDEVLNGLLVMIEGSPAISRTRRVVRNARVSTVTLLVESGIGARRVARLAEWMCLTPQSGCPIRESSCSQERRRSLSPHSSTHLNRQIIEGSPANPRARRVVRAARVSTVTLWIESGIRAHRVAWFCRVDVPDAAVRMSHLREQLQPREAPQSLSALLFTSSC